MEILRHTATFGVRRTDCARYALAVSAGQAETAYGPVTKKSGEGYGVKKSKPEYADLSEIARARDVPLAQVREEYDAGSLKTATDFVE